MFSCSPVLLIYLDDNAPPVTNYTLNINNEFVADLDFSICDYAFEAVEGIRYTVDILLIMLLEVVIKL